MGTLQGKTFSISGTLMRGRKVVVRMIEEAGGKYIREISKNVNYLITGVDAELRDTEKTMQSQNFGHFYYRLSRTKRNDQCFISHNHALSTWQPVGQQV